ncbi:co-chaperone GroES [Natronogracilivirga saccharolytica]|uniref:Co-chaperone GroES n=1 Tax=Natronogracilivirga saccharolytica TaxID=2812953 RepID=A0A8J7RLG9_9BACT|nr:co-chaperone GroES family protein [Natronogracilivirga saccharolytica]MBP3193522.1 co-chaperone GroES [Natronogracilivirga saccharolytica]
MIQSYHNDVNKFVIVGDRVLLKPREMDSRTESGLYLPPGVGKKEKIHSGYVIKAGPGYPTMAGLEDNEPWKQNNEKVQYIPLQAHEGDLAIYLQDHAHEIEFGKENYVIVPHSAILMFIREEF